MNDELTDSDINEIKAFIKTEGGRKLLVLLVNQETSLLSQSFNPLTVVEKQTQLVNRVSGIYWVRTLIQDLVDKK